MKNQIQSIFQMIGNTPLIELSRLFANQRGIRIFAKLEMFNPTGSVKDRIALHMIEKAERAGLIKKGYTLIEESSGNTGASVALVATQKGYKSIITTTDKTSQEKIALMRAYGAEVHVCPSTAKIGEPNHYLTLTQHLLTITPSSYYINQYNNLSNIEAHYLFTGQEIIDELEHIDYFIAVGSSGGTISGVSKKLKEVFPNVKTTLADPVGSVYYDYFKYGRTISENIKPYKVEGVGKDMLCSCMDFSVIDNVLQFTDEAAFSMVDLLLKKEGIFAGGSSGGALDIIFRCLDQFANNSIIVTILPDSGIKYLSKRKY